MQAPLLLDYEIYDEDGPCAPYFTGRITDADGRVMCNAENEERAAELIDYVAALRNRVERLEDLVQTLLDEDPNEQIADNGSTVLCAWRYDARRALEEK